METQKEDYILSYFDIFSRNYTTSKTYITYINDFGCLCISININNQKTYAFCRSILGIDEFIVSDSSNCHKETLLVAVEQYFRKHVVNWDKQMKMQPGIFQLLINSFGLNFKHLKSNKIRKSLKENMQSVVLSNIEMFKSYNIRKRFAEVSFFSAENIEKFILEDFLDVVVKEFVLEEICTFHDVVVTEKDILDFHVDHKFDLDQASIIIKELIYSELSVLKIMNKFYYNKILIQKEKLELYKYNDYFQHFEDVYKNCRVFVKDLISNFTGFEEYNDDNTLSDIFMTSTHKIDFPCDNIKKIQIIICRNIDYFNSFKNFSGSFENTISNVKLKDIDNRELADVFNIVMQRLIKYDSLLLKILQCANHELVDILPLKTFLIKLRKFITWCDKNNELQSIKSKTWKLCNKYNLDDIRGLYKDEVKFIDNKLILISQYILAIDKNEKLLSYIHVKDIDIHENGRTSFFIITKKKFVTNYYYKFEKDNFRMYVLTIKCLSESIKERFMHNVRCARKKYGNSTAKIVREIKHGDRLYKIPKLELIDKEWILMKYNFIMDEITKRRENVKVVSI